MFCCFVVVVIIFDYGDDDNENDDETGTLPECINKWKADIRLKLGADDWDEGGQYCTEEPEGCKCFTKILNISHS